MAAKRAKPPDTPKKIGRPSVYTAAKAREICRRIAIGEPLTSIVNTKGMPALHTIYDWLNEGKKTTFRPDFLHDYARAKQDAGDTLAAEIIAIADDRGGDTVSTVDDNGNVTVRSDSVAVQRDRLRVDARKWYASKLAPKKYGDKIVQELTGADGGPVQTSSLVTDVQARLEAFRAKFRAPLDETGQGSAPGAKPAR
jgi:hypothetical protein